MRPTPARPSRMPRRLALIASAAVLALAGCGSGSSTSGSSSQATSGSATALASASDSLTGTVTVLAAASLTESFTTLEKEFETAHPGVDVQISFGSSTTLAQQIAQGAQADLYVSAGTKALDQLSPEAKAATPHIIARNKLEIATPPDNPRSVTGLADLANPETAVVLCAETVPCGSAADQVLAKAGVTAHVVSREVDVKATLAKVALGEADAAVVYHSDVATSEGRVHGVEIPDNQNTTLDYPLLILTGNDATSAFAAYLTGAQGAAALTASGFLTP